MAKKQIAPPAAANPAQIHIARPNPVANDPVPPTAIPDSAGSTAIASNDATRATALLMADPIPAATVFNCGEHRCGQGGDGDHQTEAEQQNLREHSGAIGNTGLDP